MRSVRERKRKRAAEEEAATRSRPAEERPSKRQHTLKDALCTELNRMFMEERECSKRRPRLETAGERDAQETSSDVHPQMSGLCPLLGRRSS